MISIIICSVKPELSKKLIDNFKEYIGVKYEFIIFDNRDKRWGICKVYNYCASKAIYPFLCFVHEDVLIKTENWGKILIDFYKKTQNCGIIGFAGGRCASKNFVSWSCSDNYKNYWQYCEDKNEFVFYFNNPQKRPFSEVISLDGLFLFMSKKIYGKLKFDETTFNGFHFYDSDISIHASLNFKNFVCNGISIYHFSQGNMDKSFCYGLLKFQKKWNKELPISTINLSKLNWYIKRCHGAFTTFYLCIRQHMSYRLIFIHLLKENDILIFLFVICCIPFKFIKSLFFK